MESQAQSPLLVLRYVAPLHPQVTVGHGVTLFTGKADHGNHFIKNTWEFCQAHFLVHYAIYY